jgi:hypothetical protein
MAEGNTLQNNIDTLASFMNREGGVFTWSEEHNSNFTIDKLAIMHFMQKRVPDPLHFGKSLPLPVPKLTLKGKTVRIKPFYKYLGIHLDSQLRWTTQAH